MIINIVSVVLVLGILIFFHELGHFLIARFLGIGVRSFSLGFGPIILKKLVGQTEYRLSAVPLGGYVQLVGENREDELPSQFAKQESFALRPPWQRILVVAAGPIFNFILAWFIYWGLFFAQGQTELLPHIGQIRENSPAQLVGIKTGDLITQLNGQDIATWEQLAQTIRSNTGQEMKVRVQRNSKIFDFTLKPELNERKTIFGETVQTPMIGIVASGESCTKDLSLLEAAQAGAEQTWMVSKLTWQGLIKLVERIIPLDTIGGPIMIAQMVSQQAHEGLVNVLALMALISINLGLLNLLPIPVLDGGHILFFTIETISGRPLNDKWQQVTTRIGLSFLVGLMIVAVVNDIMRFVR